MSAALSSAAVVATHSGDNAQPPRGESPTLLQMGCDSLTQFPNQPKPFSLVKKCVDILIYLQVRLLPRLILSLRCHHGAILPLSVRCRSSFDAFSNCVFSNSAVAAQRRCHYCCCCCTAASVIIYILYVIVCAHLCRRSLALFVII
jgi:hypothetical protein